MPPSTSIADTLAHWSTVSFSDKEIPLAEIVDSLHSDEGRFVLKKSKQYSNNLVVSALKLRCMITPCLMRVSVQLWDNEMKDIATITYAYIVRYASPVQTGNFVPDGKTLPEGMMDYLR